MHPLVRGAAAVALLAAIGAPAPRRAPAAAEPAPIPDASAAAAAPISLASRQPGLCSPRSLRLQGASDTRCLPLPDASASIAGGARTQRLAQLPPSAATLRRRSPHELIPRLPDRPSPFASYQLPVDPVFAVEPPPEDPIASPGEPLELGVDIITDPQTVVTLVDLEGQSEQAEVVLVGDLYGVTVVVRHRVKRGDREREYLVFYGNLDRPGPSIVNGARLGPMAVIGYVAEADVDDEAYLYLEVRQERAGASKAPEHLSDLVRDSQSVAVDPRNVLPVAK